MGEYYLIAQLPSLDALGEDAPLPISEERFLTLCGQLLKKKALSNVENASLLPSPDSEKAAAPLVASWNEKERALRVCLAAARAKKRGKAWDGEEASFSSELTGVVNAAVAEENPLRGEKLLLNYRLRVLEELRPSDAFSEEYLYYYWLKLQLLGRIRRFDLEGGRDAYRTIYDSIWNGAASEA